MDETPLQMAPEQDPDFVSDSEKHETVINAHESGSPHPLHNHKHRKVCWRCKQPGHRRHQCRNQQRIFCSRCGRDGFMSRDCNCPTHATVRATPSKPSTTALEATLPYTERKQDGRYYLPITVAGMQIEALVDTGASLTYIGKELQRHLDKHQIKARRQTRRIQLANQTYIPITKLYPVTIELGNKSTHLLVSALPTLSEHVILGMDFLRKRDLTITIDGQPLTATRLNTQAPTDSPKGSNDHDGAAQTTVTAHVESTPIHPKAQTTATVHVETTPVHPKAQPTDDGASAQTTATAHVETTPIHPEAQTTTTATQRPMAETSARPAPPITSPEEETPANEIPVFLEGLTMTRQHFIKRSRRTLFFRGRRLALQKLEGDRVLVRYGRERCVLHLYE
uniref:Gag-Pol polyprotein n=1 Tax=Bactrocera dorsalis TaxID=27457 RepID=A0A034VZX5_BACDO